MLKTKVYLLIVITVGLVLLLAWHARASTASADGAGWQDDDDSGSSMSLHEQETIRKTFSLPAAHKTLEVDNVFGSIVVTGGAGDQVQLVVEKTLRAESAERMAAAK